MSHKLLNVLVVLGLLLSPFSSLTASAARVGPVAAANSSAASRVNGENASAAARAYWEPFDARPLAAQNGSASEVSAAQAKAKRVYRTTVRIHGVADLARLKQLKIKILSSTDDSAVVLARKNKIKQLAKLSFMPRDTERVTRLRAGSGSALTPDAASADILQATAADTDNDGLNDNEETYWCTSPTTADSDNDRVNDGAEVSALRDWILHNRRFPK